VGEESRVPLVTTPEAQMAMKVLKTPHNNMKIMEYEDPHESSTMYKYSHMMAL
jgi:hypothetical protein